MDFIMKTEQQFFNSNDSYHLFTLKNLEVNTNDLSMNDGRNIYYFKNLESFERALTLVFDETIKLFEAISTDDYIFNKNNHYTKRILKLIDSLDRSVVDFELSFDTYKKKKYFFRKEVEYVDTFIVTMISSYLFKTKLNKKSIMVLKTKFKGK